MFTTVEFAHAAGISYRQADWWIRQGILQPLGDRLPGSGSRREWDEHEIRVARVMLAVIAPHGGRVRNDWPRLAQTLRKLPADDWVGLVFVDPFRGTVSDHAHHGAVVIDLGIIDRAVTVAVEAIYEERARTAHDDFVGAI